LRQTFLYKYLTKPKAIISSSKYLLSQCYRRRVTSAEQVIPFLQFIYHRSKTPEEVQDTSHLVPVIANAFKRYLRGKGHPFVDRFENLINPETRNREMADVGMRARRFVQVVSSLEMMPVVDRTFKVSIVLSENSD
jgi:hypothetical protein